MRKFTVVEKRLGETPLQVLNRFRKENDGFASMPLTYAGRLDPMASGKLLILIGEECKNRKKYDKLDKEYEFEVLLGVESDSGDVLGLPTLCPCPDLSEKKIKYMSKHLRGRQSLSYPVFSSKTVQGKPLFEHFYDGTLDEINIPQAQTRVFNIRLQGIKKIESSELLVLIESKISKLSVEAYKDRKGADFRRDDILEAWRKLLGVERREFQIARLRATVSSGTYIRSLSAKLGKDLGSCALAYSIRRTKIGKFMPIASSGFWLKKY